MGNHESPTVKDYSRIDSMILNDNWLMIEKANQINHIRVLIEQPCCTTTLLIPILRFMVAGISNPIWD